MSFTSHDPFVAPYEGNFSARNPRSQSTSVSRWERSTNESLHQTLFQLQRPPSNPQGLPQWALRPRPLDLDILNHLDPGVDDWHSVTSDMISRATSRQFTNPSRLDQEPNQALAAKQQSTTGRRFTEGSREVEQDTFDESEISDQDETEKHQDGSLCDELPSHHDSGAEAGSKEGHTLKEFEDEGQQFEGADQTGASDDGYSHARGEAQEDGHDSTSNGKASQVRLNFPSSNAPVESHDADLRVAPRAQSAPQAKSRVGDGAEGKLVVAQELDQVLSAIEDGNGMRSRQRAGGSYSRLLKEQERLLAEFQARNIKRRTLDGHTSSSDVSSSDSESTNRATKRLKTTEDRSAKSVDLDSGDYSGQSEPEIHSASPPSERRCGGPEHRGRVPLPASIPQKVPLVPRHSPITSRGGLKKDKWSDEEDRALIELMVAQRNWETENKVPPNKWLKDVKLYAKISSQLAERGIRRSGNACKNQWNRAGRQKSGFEERPDNGTTRAKICSEQKTKKEKERRETGSRSNIYR